MSRWNGRRRGINGDIPHFLVTILEVAGDIGFPCKLLQGNEECPHFQNTPREAVKIRSRSTTMRGPSSVTMRLRVMSNIAPLQDSAMTRVRSAETSGTPTAK